MEELKDKKILKVLFLGEITGISTVKILNQKLRDIKNNLNIDLIIANSDGASDGYGLLHKTAQDILKAGVDIITTGDYILNKKDARDLLRNPSVIKPYNLTSSIGGKGYLIHEINNVKICIISIMGRINFNKVFAIDPFYSINKLLESIKDESDIIIVDFHGGATSEIQAMHWNLAGKVSAVIGTNLKVLTNDNKIINDKTAVITGAGFCGGLNSIGGLNPEVEIEKIKTGQFIYSKIETEDVVLQGALLDIDTENGKALAINLFNEKV